MQLDHSAGIVQHADDCTLRAGLGAVLRVRDRVADRVGSRMPDRPVSKPLTYQIKAISVLARTHFIMIVLGVQPCAALFGIHSVHTCYLSLYLSNEFAELKETILLLFPKPGFRLH